MQQREQSWPILLISTIVSWELPSKSIALKIPGPPTKPTHHNQIAFPGPQDNELNDLTVCMNLGTMPYLTCGTVPYKIKHNLPHDPVISFLSIYKRKKPHMHTKTFEFAHIKFIWNRPNLETTQVSANRKVNKQTVVQTTE